MLQFIARNNDKYSIAEQMQMAIEGGCQWVVLDAEDMPDEQIRELASEFVPLCKETATILTIINHVELAKELGLHGVLLVDSNRTAVSVRDDFGPEAIIGVQVREAASVLSLQGKDIDYAAFAPGMSLEKIAENVGLIRSSGMEMPLVATGDYTIDRLPEVMATGVSGVAVSSPIVDADDPVEMTALMIGALTSN